MKQYSFFDTNSQPLILGLGFFDSMHLGHRFLLEQVKKLAIDLHCQVALTTFENNYAITLDRQNSLVYTFSERLEIMSQCGVDAVISDKFDTSFSQIDSNTFLHLINNFSPAAIVCGTDYTFGCDRAGSGKLIEFCRQKKIPCVVVPTYCCDGQKISSTLIKGLLLDRKIERANELLAGDFFISGKVIDGQKQGRKMGFPTANMLIDSQKLLPEGVFCGYATLDGAKKQALINIGGKPTFEQEQLSVEVHFINFSGNLYSRTIKVFLSHFIREIQKFDNADDLREQLLKDKNYVCSKIRA